MGMNGGNDIADVLVGSYISDYKTATTTPSVVRIGTTNLYDRQLLIICNKGPNKIYVGPGSNLIPNKGIELMKGQVLSLPVGDSIDVYVVTSTGTSNYTVQEFA